LHIHPGHTTSVLECHLTAHSVDNHPPFEALSYTWGDLTDICRISCDGKSIAVTSNLKRALQQIRLPGATLTFWIDAICINQGDVDERSAQVQLMDVIYQKASTVVVWLGNATQDSPAAFKLMRQIYAVAAETTTGDCDGTMTESDLEHYKLPTRDSSYWKALDEIYWRPWFARIWIVQEIILAREAIVLCGKDRIPWSHFLIVASYIHSRNLPYLVRVDPRPPLRFNYYRHAKHFGLYTLDSLLAATRQSLSTNPLDKVYALLGISSENSIVPDYRITPCDMFRNVAKIFLLRSLDALSLVGDQVWRTTPNIPSWAPDWSYPPHEVSYLWSDLKPIFSACGNSSPIVRFSNDDKTLIVQGMILDRVNTPGGSFRRHEYVIGHPLQKLYRESWEPKMFRFWERRVLRQKQYPTGEKIETVLHKLLIANADMLPNFKLKDVDLADAYAAFRRHFASFPG
jgi:hypothetical protein